MTDFTRVNLFHNCKYFVTRKKRYCKMTVKVGEEYCGEHQRLNTSLDSTLTDDVDKDKSSKIRIVCPLDRKHTCYAHNLKKHLKICNAGRTSTEPYISKGINSGKEGEAIIDSYKLLSTFSVSDIKGVISKVNEIYEKYIKDKVSEKFLSQELVEEEMSKPEYGDKTKKHLKQVSAIVGLLDEYKMLVKPQTCYIEFGAGRGQLSYWIANAVKSIEGSTVLLVERASPKHKRDNKLNKDAYKVQRVRADICDLLLDKLDVISGSQNIVGVTKHLCGDATDLAVRCLANIIENKQKLQGVVLTFCCHHRCRWTPYVGREFFKLSENDFYMMCGMASWATCGTGLSRERRKNPNEELAQNERDSEIGLTREEKEVVGQRCKHVLNWGRLIYLEKLGFNCSLHYYVNKSISLENVCIVAFR
ncbi:tRNA:m(4)X modification enzyme TRM13 homolog isoform X2 [Anoplophora glabripennis]|uniref:tRNA:m(4)X modification enzyme TRM13 homolog isoform X2 n=1 Tax=Anoplophora glabripennis TaxID=217634 RepID=UPI00087431C1|nr:tRNA:m(4)X modification enzyme TRM13 homolog isoform X2 [Anoplophora glabripennis]